MIVRAESANGDGHSVADLARRILDRSHNLLAFRAHRFTPSSFVIVFNFSEW
jgi:hypothetical protein